MRKLLADWLRSRIGSVGARLGDRVDESWRKRAKEHFYDPVRELQVFGDLLDPSPDVLVRPADFVTLSVEQPVEQAARGGEK